MQEKIYTLLKKTLPVSVVNQILFFPRRFRSTWRARKRAGLKPLSLEALKSDLSAAGIRRGDTIMIHSSLSKIGNVEGGAMTVLNSFMQVLGKDGTLLMPAYGSAQDVQNDSNAGKVLDLRTKPSATGIITETFRNMPGTLRSSHPFSSVCAWGRHAEYVTSGHADDPRICHPSSPIARLLELRGKLFGIGVSLGPVSFYHVIEDTWDKFPFRVYTDPFLVTYIDYSGETVTREVVRYDPGVSLTRIDHKAGEWIRARFTEHFTRLAILRWFRFGQADLWVMETPQLYRELKRLAEKGITMYLTEKECISKGISTSSW